jgi:hypothetical protein
VAYAATQQQQQQQQQQQEGARAVAAAAQQLLCCVLFDQQHLGGLCEIVAAAAGMQLDGLAAAAAAADLDGTAAAAEAAEASASAAVEPPAKKRKADAQAQQQQQQQRQQSGLQAQVSVLLNPAAQALLHKAYQGQLLLRLQQLVNSSLACCGVAGSTAADGDAARDVLPDAFQSDTSQRVSKKQKRQRQAASQAQQPPSAGAAAAGASGAVLHALPQLLQGCVEAVRSYRRTLEEGGWQGYPNCMLHIAVCSMLRMLG